MRSFEYSVKSTKSFDDTVAALEQKAVENGFKVLHVHDFAATLTEKGFPREPLKVIEICNAKFASQVLAKNVQIALMLPCPLCVYTEDGETHIATMLPTAIMELYPNSDIEGPAVEVEKIVLKIITDAR